MNWQTVRNLLGIAWGIFWRAFLLVVFLIAITYVMRKLGVRPE